MAAGNYTGTQAERDDYSRLLAVERKHIALVPDGEREEIRQIFAGKGFSGDSLETIVNVIASDESRWAKTMVTEEYGLAPSSKSPMLAGLCTFAAFTLCGLIPLVTYLAASGLVPCVVATTVVFFAIGAFKSRWSLSTWWQSGFGTFCIGHVRRRTGLLGRLWIPNAIQSLRELKVAGTGVRMAVLSVEGSKRRVIRCRWLVLQ